MYVLYTVQYVLTKRIKNFLIELNCTYLAREEDGGGGGSGGARMIHPE
jgi:hypothetical protein